MPRPDRIDDVMVTARRVGSRFSSVSAFFGLLFVVFAIDARAAVPLPIDQQVEVPPGAWSQTYSIDLGTLPTRPWLVVAASSDHFSAPYVSVAATSWDLPGHPGPLCPAGTTSFSNGDYGGATVSVSLVGCDPRPGAFAGQTVDVQFFVYNFVGEPVPVSIEVRGETRPPTGTLIQQVDPPNVAMQIALPASKDTVVYADDASASNGAGPFLWAGDRLTAPPPFGIRYPRRSLVAFDLNGSLPPIATVLDANLRLTVTSANNVGEPLWVQRVAPGSSVSWGEGTAVAPNDGFYGVSSPSLYAADWFFRERPESAWSTPGVDVGSGALGVLNVLPGPLVLSSPALASAVQAMITDGTGDAGFLLTSPNPQLFPIPIQLASREHPVALQRPELIVSYRQPEVYESGNVSTNVVNFINEGQNFRWVYDVSVRDSVSDGKFVTDNGGICQVVAPSDPPRFVPYTYGFQGSPAFTGVDCCTWRVESPQTGTVGTGQALFFHGLDASNPANMPPDSDQDGIRDNCDNCPAKANGPLFGTCLIGLLGSPCHSNGECGPGGKCNLSQEDSNGDFVGNVCAVPEPGFTLGFGTGVLALALSLRAPAGRGRGRRSSSGS